MSRRQNVIGAVGAAVAATAAIGAAATQPDSSWYRTRRKPGFTPPTWAFPAAWTSLYLDLAATGGRTLADLDDADAGRARTYAAALAANLALNAGWTVVFFRAQNLPLATGWAAALTASGVDLVRRTAPVSPARAAALAAYPAWCAFATVLSGSIWRRNR